MADQKLTALSALTAPSVDDLLYVVDDPAGSPVSYKITYQNLFKFPNNFAVQDANGNELVIFATTASAVNEIKITNGATGVPASIIASGETNIGILLAGKGTGKIRIGDGADNTKLLTWELVGATTAKTLTLISSHTDNRSITYPDATTTLVGTDVNQTLSLKTLTAPKIASGGFIADANGNELIIFTTTASAVNEITFANAATGAYPTITASGGDTDIGLKFVPKGSAHGIVGVMETIMAPISDETTAITTGTAKITFRMPYAFKVIKVKASLTTASSSGAPQFDINEAGVSILSTKLTIDANELTSETAAVPPVISDSALADDGEITVDVDGAGTGAKGAKIYIIGYATAKAA